MGQLEDFIGTGFGEMVDKTGSVVATINDHSYLCVVGDDEVGNALQAGGYVENRKFEIHIRKSDFVEDGSAIMASDTVAINGQNYRVDEVITSPGDPCICFRCISMQK